MGQYVPFDSEKNRDEYLLIEFDNILVNVNYMIIRYMLDNFDKYISKYPGLELFKSYEDDVMYIMSLSSTRKGLLTLLSDDKLSEDNTREDLLFIEKMIDFNDSGYVQKITVSLSTLALQDKIKEIYVYSENLTLSKQIAINNIFSASCQLEKVYALEESSFTKMLKDEPKITTVLCQNADNVTNAIKLNAPVIQKQFLLPSCPMNADREKVMQEGVLEMKLVNNTIQILAEHGCNITYYIPNFYKREENEQ